MEKGSAEYEKILDELVGYCNDSGTIDQNLYVTYDVKRGLRDSNGKGVLTGLTEISDVSGIFRDIISKIWNVDSTEASSALRRRSICFYSVNCRPELSLINLRN